MPNVIVPLYMYAQNNKTNKPGRVNVRGLLSGFKKHDIMKTLELTSEQYAKAIQLGIYEQTESISQFEKIVIHYKLCLRTEKLLIKLTK